MAPDRYSFDMMNAVMGDGMTSRLFMEIRERRGLAYEVHSSSMHYRDCGALMVYCGVDTSKAEETIQAVLDEMAKMSEGVTSEELARSVEYSCGRLDLRLEDTRAVMSWLGGQELLRDEVLEPDTIIAALRAVTTDQVVEAARKYLKDPGYRLAVVGPYKADAAFQKLLG
jgi:predicted Zn-dependent peptidase